MMFVLYFNIESLTKRITKKKKNFFLQLVDKFLKSDYLLIIFQNRYFFMSLFDDES
jgi:hypothetical protein